MKRTVRAPRLVHRGALVHAFDEDDVTLAWDAVQAAGATGRLRTVDLDLPAWWWQGTGLTADADADWTLTAAMTRSGPVVVVHPTHEDAGADAAADAAVHGARDIDIEEHARIQAARDEAPREEDFPLGAFVTPQRHDEVLAARMRMGPGRIVTWTTVAAPPTEFQRALEATGPLHVVMVALEAGGRTVGLWTGAPSTTGGRARPVLRRLLRQQGAWRYGIKFAP